MKTQTLKGFRDFLPQDVQKRQFVIRKLEKAFKLYGFEPLETPALEYEELLTGKYGDEGEKLMYRFEDRGKRRIAMRYDQTVPLARVYTQYKNELPVPFKRYQIQPVWRAENTQKGRYREFLQCDADTLGISTPLADAELLALASTCLESIGFRNFTVLINDRKVFSTLTKKGLVPEDKLQSVVQTIDKLKKIGQEGVIAELESKGFKQKAAKDILQTIENQKPNDYIKNIQEALSQMQQDLKKFVFEPTLARGLDYYTDLIFEIEIDGFEVGSVCGGGRYNNLIKDLTGEDVKAAGFAFGFDRLIEAAEEKGLFNKNLSASPTTVLVTIFSQDLEQESIKLAADLRKNYINTQLYEDSQAKLEKQLKYANKKNIQFAAIIGPSEKEKKEVNLKNLFTGEQKTILQKDLPHELKK